MHLLKNGKIRVLHTKYIFATTKISLDKPRVRFMNKTKLIFTTKEKYFPDNLNSKQNKRENFCRLILKQKTKRSFVRYLPGRQKSAGKYFILLK